MAEDEIFKEELEIKVGEDRFIFRIPTFYDEIKIGFEARQLRRELDPMGVGAPDGLDYSTFQLVQTVATMRVVLKQSSAKWVKTPTEKGDLIIDYTKWNADAVAIIEQVGAGYVEQLGRFRARRAAHQNGDGQQDMAPKPNP